MLYHYILQQHETTQDKILEETRFVPQLSKMVSNLTKTFD